MIPHTETLEGAWRDPSRQDPPLGRKLILLTETGCAVIGCWERVGYLAWAPLPSKPEWLKNRLNAYSTEK
jgi:hypothetical protein